MTERTLWEAPRSGSGGREGRRGGHGRGGGGRTRGRGHHHQPGQGELWDGNTGYQRMTRNPTTVILAKPPTRERDQSSSTASGLHGKIQIKKRNDGFPRQPNGSPSRGQLAGTSPTGGGLITITRRSHDSIEGHHSEGNDGRYQHVGGILQTRRLAVTSTDCEEGRSGSGSAGNSDVPPQMRWVHQMPSVPCVKMLDESFKWDDRALEFLQDQTEFLVVGVLGMQGVGKSTVMSLLAGTRPQEIASKSQPFKTSTRDALECGMHQTCGIDIAVSTERVILLDTQPILSASVLDRLLQHERQVPVDMKVDNYAELQSYQLAAFLFSVCHIVLVVQDWFCNADLLNFLLTAEMLKPLPPPNVKSEAAGGASLHNDPWDCFPHCLFVYNKASSEDFGLSSLRALHQTTAHKFKHSRLAIRSGASLLRSGLLPCEERHCTMAASDVNIFLLPSSAVDKQSGSLRSGSRRHAKRGPAGLAGSFSSLLPLYRGHPTFATLAEQFCYEVLSLPRRPLSPHGTLTETQWFHFAARTWDSIRKCGLMSDYNRLLHE